MLSLRLWRKIPLNEGVINVKKWFSWAGVAVAVPWIISGFLFAKLHEVRTRLSIETTARMADGDRRSVEFHNQMREDQIGSELANAVHPVVFIGDSVTERAQLPADICGHSIVNAGIAGIGISRALPVAERLARTAPAAVVIAVGINDAMKTEWLDGLHQQTFKLAYQATIAAALLSTPNVMVASLAPVDLAGSVGRLVDRDGYTAIENTIHDLPVKQIDLSSLAADTIDGVHFSPSGKEAWTSKMVAGVKIALGCGTLAVR